MESKNCSRCNFKIYSSNNIMFCPSCGFKNEMTSNRLKVNKEDILEEVNNHINNKEYDQALEKLVNLELYHKDKEIYMLMLKCFDLVNEDSENCINVHMFSFETLNDIYDSIYKLNYNNEEIDNRYNSFKEEKLKEFNELIISIDNGINQNKIMLERFNSMPKYSKPKYYNVLLASFLITLIFGIILGFAFNNNIANYIGYILSAIGVIAIMVIAFITPSINTEDQIKKVTYLINKAKESKKEIEAKIESLTKRV